VCKREDHMQDKIKLHEEKMGKSIDVLQEEFSTIRAGRANPHVLDKIKVDYYGTPTPLQQLGNISVPEARMIVIQPWEKALLKEIEKAINISDLGIHPTNDGNVIRLVFPELTEERRHELAKDIKKKGEAAKVAVRNIRRDAIELIKKAEKAGEISEDEMKKFDDKVQKATDKSIEKIDGLVDSKTKEIMKV
jgi:ribosome recycling factor